MAFHATNQARTLTATLPLLNHSEGGQAIAWRDGGPVSVTQFLQEARQLAARLPERPFVFNLCSDRYHFLTTFCAALLRGQTNLLPPNRAEQTLLRLHSLYPNSYGICDEGTMVPIPALPYPKLSDEPAEFQPPAEVAGEHTAAILFTSGSTGEPQPYAKSWQSLVKMANLTAERLAIRPGTQFVATVPPQHMYGLESSLMLPMQNGCALYAGQPLFPADIRRALMQIPSPRVFITTPLHLRICLEEEIRLPPLELILSAAAPLSRDLAQQAEAAFGAPVHEIYGCTEAGAIATRRTVKGEMWFPLSGLCVASDGEDSWVEGAHLPVSVPLQDVVATAPDGCFRLLGRKAEMVNIAGKRASLAALNHQLNQIPGVRDGLFFAPEDQPGVATRLIALVVAPGISENVILAQLRQSIDPAFLPRPLYKVASLPRNATGKLPRAALQGLIEGLCSG